MTKMPSFFVSTFSRAASTESPRSTLPKTVYCASRWAARPSSIEKLEPPLFGSLIRPMLRIPRTCGTSVNSPGTVFFASSLHSALSGFWTELASTDCTCATKPLSTRNT